MPSQEDIIASIVVQAAVKHGMVIAGACAAFVAVLAIESLVLSALEVKIECSSHGLDVATWMPRAEWERGGGSGSVRMDAGGFFIAIPVEDCDSVS